MGNHLMVGGQAVIEGVMMRGPKLTATAVRDPGRDEGCQLDLGPLSHPQEAAAARHRLTHRVACHRHPLALVFGQDGR